MVTEAHTDNTSALGGVASPSSREKPSAAAAAAAECAGADHGPGGRKERNVMRKWMTRVFDEALSQHPELVYLGEDVEHGGVRESVAVGSGRVRLSHCTISQY